MRMSNTAAGLIAVAGVVLSSGGRSRAACPVGLEAIERFELVSKLRQGVRTYQYSSHDPSGANNDSGNYLYEVGNEHVLLDVKGPGCIYRFWFTGPINGGIRIYFDGSSTPLVDMGREEFFSGGNVPFLAPLVGDNVVSSGGYYCYLPMPFRQGCRITTTGADHYYNITFQRFADDTGITTFTGTEDSWAARALWSNTGADPKPDPGNTTITDTVDLPVGSSVTMADISSPGIVQQLEITIPGLTPGALSETILSGLQLEVLWDGSPQASVDVPLGDFFGSGLGAATVDGLAVGMDGERLYCFFPMPFASAALMRIVNASTVNVDDLSYTVRYTALASGLQDVGRFHAKFLSETPTATGRDYLILEETGAGHFVGVVQTLKGYGADRWHLEGDERIYVDGQLTPALYGTGTEDFYNGGWYFSHGAFTLPVHGCPRRNYESPFLDTCYRFFLSDLIPFTTSIRVGIEHGPRNDVSADIRSVAFYYKVPEPLAALSDELDVGSSVSENAHGYVATGGTWAGTSSGTYEGDDDDVTVTDNGRRLAGGSEFTVAVAPPDNAGVLLRSRVDYSRPHQQARVYVDDVLGGIWYEPGENDHHIFRDAEFMIPPSLTQQKNEITVRIENISPQSDWTEYRYWVYTLVPLHPAIALDPEVLDPVTTWEVDPPDDSFTVTNAGGGTLNYTITDGVNWLSVLPDSGSSTGEPDTIQVIYEVAGLSVGTHNATITVADPNAGNSPQTVAVHLLVNPIPGDFDVDFDVDQEDFGHFQVCLSGPGVAQNDQDCLNARLDEDEDVDRDDFVVFMGCVSGAGVPALPTCASGAGAQ